MLYGYFCIAITPSCTLTGVVVPASNRSVYYLYLIGILYYITEYKKTQKTIKIPPPKKKQSKQKKPPKQKTKKQTKIS